MEKQSSPHTDRELIRRIGRSANCRAGYKQLVRELGLGGGRERRLLVEQLNRLVARGELSSPKLGLWSLPVRREQAAASPGAATPLSTSGRDRLVSGRLDVHPDGFGFVRPDAAGSRPNSSTGDIFIPPGEKNGAMQGDLVLVDEAPAGRDGRRSGRIARVLTRRNMTVVGIFHSAPTQRHHAYGSIAPGLTLPHGNYVVPFDERLGGPIEIPDGMEIVEGGSQSPHRTLQQFSARPTEDQPANPLSSSPLPERPALDGLAVDVEVLHFPQGGRPARGRMLEVLGRPDDFGVDTEIIIRKHHLPHVFPPSVLREADERAQAIPADAPADELDGREDFRDLPIVTIDGETARDFDDAVLVRPLPNGHTELQVHIADVSRYVLAGSLLDTEARVRGNSVYFPDRAVPMLPHALSSGVCSLKPGEDRFVLSCLMEIDGSGEIVSFRLSEGLIRSARRCTYTAVQQCLNASPSAAQWNAGAARPITPEPAAEDLGERERWNLEQPEIAGSLDRMLELALRLNAKRTRRGSIDFDLPEPVVRFDPDGNMKAIVRSERGWAHRLIEEFMLSANECVATWLEAQGIASIYRIHEMPDPKRILDFEETAAGFGQSLGVGALSVRRFTMKSDRRETQRRAAGGRATGSRPAHESPDRIPVTPQMYQRLVRRIAGKPEERILAYLMLRSLKQARYAEKNEGHFALASPSYTHFTSPIRRYPDLIVHRLIRERLRQGAHPRGGPIRSGDAQPWTETADARRAARPTTTAADPLPATELEDIAAECSQTERRAADAERELIEWKKMKFMSDKVGDDFRGIILSVTKYGFFVELDEMFIEGLVPLHSLVGDHYTFRDTDRTICGARTGHCFAAGQRVQVLLDRIDRQQRRLQFALLPGTEPQGSSGRTARPAEKSSAGKAAGKRTAKKSGKRLVKSSGRKR